MVRMEYEHAQRGRLTLLTAGFLILIGAIALPGLYTEEPISALILLGAILVIVATVIVFNRLTVTVDANEVAARFGWGWPKRVIAFHEIAAVRQVRNKWIYGWGSRWIPGGWMFNVWGRDAVEIDLTTGSKFRIGTDQPEELLAAFPVQLIRT